MGQCIRPPPPLLALAPMFSLRTFERKLRRKQFETVIPKQEESKTYSKDGNLTKKLRKKSCKFERKFQTQFDVKFEIPLKGTSKYTHSRKLPSKEKIEKKLRTIVGKKLERALGKKTGETKLEKNSLRETSKRNSK